MRSTTAITDEQQRLTHINKIVDESASVFDLLLALLTHQACLSL